MSSSLDLSRPSLLKKCYIIIYADTVNDEITELRAAVATHTEAEGEVGGTIMTYFRSRNSAGASVQSPKSKGSAASSVTDLRSEFVQFVQKHADASTKLVLVPLVLTNENTMFRILLLLLGDKQLRQMENISFLNLRVLISRKRTDLEETKVKEIVAELSTLMQKKSDVTLILEMSLSLILLPSFLSSHDYKPLSSLEMLDGVSLSGSKLFLKGKKETRAMERVYIVMDLETTGLNVKRDEIVQLAAHLLKVSPFNPTNSRTVGIFDKYIRPSKDIHPEASKVHGLYAADLVHCPPANPVLSEFVQFLEQHSKGVQEGVLVAHNGTQWCFILSRSYCLRKIRKCLRLPHFVSSAQRGGREVTAMGHLYS
jgi:hypothetical protein